VEKWIVKWPVGGGMDSYTRAFTKQLEKELGQRIVIQNVRINGRSRGAQ
jgi:tripartite-type tricarboxylate transporter receptor subunit TctC